MDSPATFSEIMDLLASSILFIDSQVADYLTLLEGLTLAPEIIIIPSQVEGLKLVTSYLRRGYEEVHFISHGSPGKLVLGKDELSLNTVGYSNALLREWQVKQIHIYACQVAVGDAGEELVERLHLITKAGVVAVNKLIRDRSVAPEFVQPAVVNDHQFFPLEEGDE